jgi:ATP-dependent DNA ligase
VLDGKDRRREPLEVRKATLASVLRGRGAGLRLVEPRTAATSFSAMFASSAAKAS